MWRIKAAAFATIFLSGILSFIIPFVCVEGPSMNDTLADGDYVIINIENYTPERGDIVAFNYKDRRLIKRVIGVAGDRVEVDTYNNSVILNGQVLDEPYVNYPNMPGTDGEIEVSEGYVFLMGDNRSNSFDSRQIGCVSVDDIVGKVVWRFWPLSSFGGLYDGVDDSIYETQ